MRNEGAKLILKFGGRLPVASLFGARSSFTKFLHRISGTSGSLGKIASYLFRVCGEVNVGRFGPFIVSAGRDGRGVDRYSFRACGLVFRKRQ